ncbi:MAG: DUF2953 domain-containing protein [Clostridia bacterium]|nr:DUF2953 domain-containing protein [Clostridia bacterium]
MAIYLFFVFIALILLAFIPIQIHITYQRIDKRAKLKIVVKVFFITICKTIPTPVAKVFSLLARPKYNVKNIKESLKANKLPERNWLLVIRRMNIWLPRVVQIIYHGLKLTAALLKPIKCKKLNIYTKIGLHNPSQTGIVYGSLWAGYSFIISQLSKWMVLQPETPVIKIEPDFNAPKVHLEYDCIIAFPLGHIIIVLIQTLRFIRVSSYLFKGISL